MYAESNRPRVLCCKRRREVHTAGPEFEAQHRCRSALFDSTPTRYRRYVPESTHRLLSRLRMFVPACVPSPRAFQHRYSSRRRTMVVSQASCRFLAPDCESTLDAIASPVRVVRSVKRLMHIADKMDQERQITGSAPSVISPFFEACRVFINLTGDAVTAGASRRNVCSLILQTNVDEMPRRRRTIFFAKLRIRTDRGVFHRGCYLSVGTPRMFATWLCAAGVRLSAAMIATILCPSLPQPHAGPERKRTANNSILATQTDRSTR